MTYATLTAQRPRLNIPTPRHTSPAAVSLRPQAETTGQPPVRDCYYDEPLHIRISTRDDYTLVYLAGALDVATYDDIHGTLFGLLATAGPRLVLDVGGVTFTDAHGISPLVSASTAAARVGGWVRLARASDRLRWFLDTALYAKMLPTYDTVAAAAASAAQFPA
jgi:anti-anti-sigma factor